METTQTMDQNPQDSEGITEKEVIKFNKRWGKHGWERHKCPSAEGLMATHSIHFHHDRRVCNPIRGICNESIRRQSKSTGQ